MIFYPLRVWLICYLYILVLNFLNLGYKYGIQYHMDIDYEESTL